MEVLRRRYRVLTLKDWLFSVLIVPGSETQCSLVKDDDNLSYASLLTDVYVCEERSVNQHVKLQKSEASSQKEVVIKAIENILKKHGFGKNVLSDGFCLLSTDRFAQQCGANVESRYPNSCVNRLYYSVWDTLLSRIGDTAMMYMLENMSLFYRIADTCFVQLTGLSVNSVTENIDITDEVGREPDGENNRLKTAANLDGNTVNLADNTGNLGNTGDLLGNTMEEDMPDEPDTESLKMKNNCFVETSGPDVTKLEQPIHNHLVGHPARTNKTNENIEENFDILDNIAYIDKENVSEFADTHRKNIGELDRSAGYGQTEVVFENRSGTYSGRNVNQGECVVGRKQNETKNEKDLNREGLDKCSSSSVADTETNNSISSVPNTTTSSMSSVANTGTNISTKRKWKRKYEQIGDTRFQLLKHASEMYAKTKLQVKGNGAQPLMHVQSIVAESVCSQQPGISRKRKSSEVLNVEKQSRISNKRKGSEVLNDEKLPTISRKRKRSVVLSDEMTDKCMNEHDAKRRKVGDHLNDSGNVPVLEADVKAKECRTTTRNVVCKDKVPRNKKTRSKCPMFSYHLALLRGSVLFTRNPRGTFLKSATLSTMSSSPDCILSLYKDIFWESQITTEQCCINVKIPELDDFKVLFCNPPELLTCHASREHLADVLTCKAHGVQQKLPSQFMDHPSFCSNDSMFLSSAVLCNKAYGLGNNASLNSRQGKHSQLSSCRKDSGQTANQNKLIPEQAKCNIALHLSDKKSLCFNPVSPFGMKIRHDTTSAKLDTKSCISSAKHDTKTCISSAKEEDESVLLTCQQIDKMLNETTSDNDSVSKMLSGNNGMDKPNVNLNSLVVRDSRGLPGITVTVANDHSYKKCVIGGKGTVTSRDDFGFVLVTDNKLVSVDSTATLPLQKHVSRHTLSTKEKLLAKRNEKLLADMTHDNVNGYMNVLNVSHESITSRNTSHSSSKSFHNLDTTLQSSGGSSSNSNRQTDSGTLDGSVIVDGSGTDNTLHIDVPVLKHVVPLLKEFIEKHRSCPYVRFLNKHCPVVKRSFKKTNKPSKIKGFGRRYTAPSVSGLLSDHIHNRKVYMFVRLCVLYVLPDGLLGGRHNQNVVMKNISRIISLGRHEKVTIGQLVSGMRTKDVLWLSEVKSNNTRIYLLACIIYWWYTNYIFLVLRTFFYVTDTSFLRYKLLYYRQSTWNQLHILGMKGLMKRGILRPISEKHGFEMLESRRSLGLSSLRFLPKPKSLRPIMNMGRSVQVTKTQGLSVNKQLSGLHSVLTYMKNKKPSLIRHGKLGMDEIYRTWKEYLIYWRSVGSPELYFVKTDIANCYDSIDQKKLCSIIEKLFHTEMLEEEYIIRKYFSVRMNSGSIRKQFHRVVAPISEFHPDFISYCKHLVSASNLQNVVFVDAVVYQHETCASLISLLRSLLLNTVVKVGSQYYIQGAGISQGSVLSTLLCNLYYTSMEGEYLHVQNEEKLMRIVDDYLFVTPYRKHAETFLNKMLDGVPDYNCVTNMQKVLMNFDYKFDGEPLPAITTGWFPWCGVLINMKTLEVALDCSRNTGFNMRDTLTMELSKHPGKSLKEKMTMCVSKKYHDIYVDPYINTEKQMLTNIHQIFTQTACKFHAAIRQLPYKERAEKNPNYYLGIIKEVSGVTVFLVRRLLHATGSNTEDLATKIQWICLQACYKTLIRYHSQYNKLLKLLETNMKQLQRRIGRPMCIDIQT